MEGEGSPESKEKTKMDALSKEDLVQKCTKLLHISRQAQLAKQESTIQLKQIQEKFIAAEKIIEELKTSNESLVKDLKECNHIRDSVVNKLGQVNVETKQLIEQGEKLTNDIEFLKQEKLKLYEELSSSQKENEILRQTTGDLEVRLMQMNEVKGEMEFKIKELNKKNQSESKLSDTIRELNEENIGLKQKVELQEAENQLIQTTVNTLEKTLDKKETLIAEYAEDIRKLQQEEKKMKETLSEVTNRFEDEVKRLQGACDEKDNVKNKLEDKVKELNVICDENNNVIKNFQAELKKLQDTLSEKEQIIDSHVETIGQLKQTVRDAEERVKMIQKGDEEKTKALESVQSALSEKDRVIEALNEAIRKESSAGLEGNDKLKQMTLDISEKQQKLNTCEADLKEAHRKLVSLEKTNDTNVEKLDRLSAELSDKNEAIEKLENDLIEKDKMFKSTLQNKEVECSELMNSVQREMEHKTIALQEMETVQTVLKQNLEVITGLENDLKGRDAELDQATNRIELLVFELDEKSILLKQLEGDVLQRDEQVVALRTALKEKEERLEQVVALQTALKETEERLEVKEERLKDLENETKTAAEQLKRAEKEFEESRAKVADLEHELGEKKAALENEKKTKEELLKNKEANRTLIDTELEQLKKDLEDTQAKLVETNQQIVSKCELIETQSHQLEAARVLIESLERAIQNSEDSQREKSNYELEKQENFKLSLENLENDNIRCKREIEHLTEELERASERYRSKCSENEELKRMYDAMNGNYAKLNTDHQQQLVRIQTTARLLAALKQEKSQLLTYVRETQHAVHADIACAVRYADKMKTIRTEQDQLLREMSEMNESLKGRGEKIYSLNEEIGRLESEKQEAQQSLATMENEMKQLRAQLDGKQQNLATLENEMKDLRAQLNGKEHSLATVEEEMKDLRSELSEEKDVKKRMNEEITKLKGELKKKEELGVTMATQSASLDKMETLSTSTISKADETNRMKDIEDTYEDRYMKLKLLTIKYKKSYVETNEKLTTLTNENAALMSKLQALTNQIKTTQILQSEYDSLCEKQDADARTLKSNAKFIAQLTHDKETLENSLRSLRTQLNDASTQKSDALAKYASLKEKFDEKQVSDIIMKDKDHEIAKLTDTNTHLSEQIVELRTRIAQCTSRNVDIAQCERQLDEAKVRISELETKLEAMEEMSQTLNTVQENYTALKLSHSQLEADHKVSLSQLSALSESYQAAKSRTEELLVDNTQLCRDRDRLEEATRVRNELTSQLTGVEMQLNEVKADKARLEKEFETYKRKAQSVLEKHKKGQLDATSASTEENNGKLLALEKQVDDLKTELNQSQQELSRARQSLATTASENTALASQLHRVRDDLSASAQSLAQAKEDKMNADLLATMYRQQVEEQGTRIKELKATVAGLREEVAKLAKTDVKDERIVEKKLEVEVDDRRRMEEVLSANNLTNMASLYREEGEGSEYTDTPAVPSHIPISLEELLSSSEDQFQHEEDILAQLSSCQSQILHLTTLLNESENNAARHEQQTNFLKQEIRRLERAVERQPHVQNTEYLKNVIIKFLTLQGGDERQRLVPVLNTMLKLSPDEVKQLTGVAKGVVDGASSWSSLLGGWSAGSTT